MDFNLNDEQELFVAGIRELMASENWEAYFAECDRDSVYPERFVKALADMGIDSLLLPAGSTPSCAKAHKSRSTKLWLSAAPVSRCGTQRLPNRARAPTWVA